MPVRPGGASIAKATAVAAAAAAVVLVTTVLPAEYGIDPLGTGRATGLLDLYEAAEAPPPPIAAAQEGPIRPQSMEYRHDVRQLTVPSLGSIEFKYQLAKGAAVIYSWRATAPLDFDFHTEPAGRPSSASETFERGEAMAKHGFYTAPYDGIHGWYWQNLTAADVIITLEATGFFSEARLFVDDMPPQRIAIPAREIAVAGRPAP
jgi:hypothetical protein